LFASLTISPFELPFQEIKDREAADPPLDDPVPLELLDPEETVVLDAPPDEVLWHLALATYAGWLQERTIGTSNVMRPAVSL
jgi:hypothetical protein